MLRNEVMDGETFAALCRDRALPEEPKQPEAATEAEQGEPPAEQQTEEAVPDAEAPPPTDTWPPQEENRTE